jgi:Leucine-rich repeat (LRR) protein
MAGLYIHDDILAERRVRRCKETESTELDFSHLRLHRIPPETAELTRLKTLNFDIECDWALMADYSHADLLEVPEFIGNLTNLETLNISLTCMVKFPLSMRNLVNLKTLRLPIMTWGKSPSLKVENFAEFLRRWPNLEHLSLSADNVPALLESLDFLPHLRRLEIGGFYNRNDAKLFEKTLDKISALPKLTELSIGGKITEYHEYIKRLYRLKKLKTSLYGNEQALSSLGDLINLEELELGGNAVKLP